MVLIASHLTNLVLYTISEDHEGSRDALEAFLKDQGFVSEGDQSTMMKRFPQASLKAGDFLEKLNELCLTVPFKHDDRITLILPGVYERRIPKKCNPILKRYQFRYDGNSKVFTNYCEKRDLIKDFLGIRVRRKTK